MGRWYLFFVLFIGLYSATMANNIKIDGEAKVIQIQNDTAIVEFKISWDNSWRDDFNWDAAWIFFKYKKRGAAQQWQHAYLGREGHDAMPLAGNQGGAYSFMFGEVGTGVNAKVTGVYLLRDGISEGNVNARIRVKWAIKANSKLPLASADFGENFQDIYIAAYAIEMVYVPYGSYALGDNFSNGAFLKVLGGPISPAQDLIDLNSGYVYTTDNKGTGTGTPSLVADRLTTSMWPTSSFYYHVPAYWQVDFKTPKKIEFFGIAGANNYPDCTPRGNWYLKGSNDLKVWNELYTGSGEYAWEWDPISYPVSRSIKVTKPGYYRYYRIEINASNRSSDNGIVIQSVAMTEEDIYPNGYYCLIENENPLALGNELAAGDGQSWTGTLPAAYPKGYRGFYIMKYETSQQQYVEFLNSLTLAQQKNRVANNNFSAMEMGDYVFGELKKPNARNGIAFITLLEGGCAVFGNNLNPANKINAVDDGQTIACNYLSPNDMLAYCDWSGLRPMSELEYEKACRRPSPQIPDKGEYAWNRNSGVNPLRSLSDLTNAQTEMESPFDYTMNVNVGSKIKGPVRSGAFATPRTGQVESGGTYWGGMEMSGNLWELCYTANVGGRGFVADNATTSHGDGDLSTAVPTSVWPSTANAFGVRGGSFNHTDQFLRTSDRTYAYGNYFKSVDQRDSTVSFRAVRSVLNTIGFKAGDIYCQNNRKTDTICSDATYVIKGNMAENTIGKVTYSWYKSEDNGNTWVLQDNENGLNLSYTAYTNTSGSLRVVRFKRKTVCAVGEEESVPVAITISTVVKAPTLNSYSLKAALGYRFVLPQPLNNSMQSKWLYPSGKITDVSDAVINNYTTTDDGIYKLYNIAANGCESQKVDVKVIGIDGIPIVDYGTYKAWADGTYARSANEYLNPVTPYIYQGKIGSGVFKILPGGQGTTPITAYCDMETDGGGWTMVVAQFENDPLSNWNQGIQADYDPSLKTSKSFTLNTSQLPPHTQTAWGKHLDPTFVGYSNFVYTTTNTIPLKTLLNIKTGKNFQVHRDPVYFYSSHDPENSRSSYNGWNMTLTYDQMGGTFHSWAFSPLITPENYRGYGMAGLVYSTLETYAWTVWVR